MSSVIGPILWWHIETIKHKTKGKNNKERLYHFSPVGIGPKPKNWLCIAIEEENKTIWEDDFMGAALQAPSIPKAVFAIARKKLKNIKSKPYPGRD